MGRAPRSGWALRYPAASAGSLDPYRAVEDAAALQLIAGKQFQQAPCLAPSTRWSSISDEKSDQSSPNAKWRSVIVVRNS
jgi:hypothetical protein